MAGPTPSLGARRGLKFSLGLSFSVLAILVAVLIIYYWACVASINQSLNQPKISGPVELRLLPYPFRAAVGLTISPGAGLSLRQYVDALRRLNMVDKAGPENGKQKVEAGGSFFFYPPSDDWLAYFNPPGPEGAHVRRVINDLIRGGVVDVLDSYGQSERFEREMAKKALDALASQGLIVHTWADRFPSPDNLGLKGGRGAHVGRMSYHLDLTTRAGLRFFWLGREAFFFGQEAIVDWDSFQCLHRSSKPASSLFNLAKFILKHFLLVITTRRTDPLSQNRLLGPMTLKDGTTVFEYIRYHPPAAEASLAAVFKPSCLDFLVARGGRVIVASVLSPGPDGRLWSAEDEAALDDLAARMVRGRILVTTATRLLNLTLMTNYLQWEAKETGGEVHIFIHALNDPVSGQRTPRLSDLAGLTFYVPWSQKIRVFLADQELTVKRNLIDHTGRESVSLPWPRLKMPAFNQD